MAEIYPHPHPGREKGAALKVIICPDCSKELDNSGENLLCPGCRRVFGFKEGILNLLPLSADAQKPRAFFRPEWFWELEAMEKTHFWFAARNYLIRDLIGKFAGEQMKSGKMLELGCGNGRVLLFLQKAGIDCRGGDFFEEALLKLRKNTEAKLYRLDAQKLPFQEEFEMIGMFDLLEHIEDDQAVLSRVKRALKPGGRLFLSVPANPSLWSRFDRIAEHKRRYQKAELREKLEKAGFKIEKLSFFLFFLYPLVYLSRILRAKTQDKLEDGEIFRRETRIDPVLNNLFFLISLVEARLIHYFNMPWGSSLVAVARKEA